MQPLIILAIFVLLILVGQTFMNNDDDDTDTTEHFHRGLGHRRYLARLRRQRYRQRLNRLSNLEDYRRLWWMRQRRLMELRRRFSETAKSRSISCNNISLAGYRYVGFVCPIKNEDDTCDINEIFPLYGRFYKNHRYSAKREYVICHGGPAESVIEVEVHRYGEINDGELINDKSGRVRIRGFGLFRATVTDDVYYNDMY